MANKPTGLQGVFTHKEVGGKYKITAMGKMQIGQKWIDCIIYQRLDVSSKPTRDYYVREYDDFNQKFKNIKPTL